MPWWSSEWYLISECGDQRERGLERKGPHPMERVFEGLEVGEVTKGRG